MLEFPFQKNVPAAAFRTVMTACRTFGFPPFIRFSPVPGFPGPLLNKKMDQTPSNILIKR